ncbi:hypothetical protein Peur_030940 [Populus x canadensis]
MLILEIWFSNSDVINGERELSFDTVLQFSSDDNKLSLDLGLDERPLQCLEDHSDLLRLLILFVCRYGWFSGESNCRNPTFHSSTCRAKCPVA